MLKKHSKLCAILVLISMMNTFCHDVFIQSVVDNYKSISEQIISYKSSVEMTSQVLGKKTTQNGVEFYLRHGKGFFKQTLNGNNSVIQTVVREDSLYIRHNESKWAGSILPINQTAGPILLNFADHLNSLELLFQSEDGVVKRYTSEIKGMFVTFEFSIEMKF